MSRSTAFVAALTSAIAFAGCWSAGDSDAPANPREPSSTSTTEPATAVPATPTAADLCDAADPVQSGTVAETALVETSGLAASRAHPGVLWAHNDSGDTARVFALDTSGKRLGEFALFGAEAKDWEDVALGPGPAGADALYVGDIGDNDAERFVISLYRFAEPDPRVPAGPLPTERIDLTYPDGAHDAEALLVDPVSGDLVIVTKALRGNSGVYRVAGPVAAGGHELEHTSDLDLGLGQLVTAGDVTADGSMVALRTYTDVWLWGRASGSLLADAFAGGQCAAPAPDETQGEAIAFAADGRGYLTIGEGVAPPVWQVTVGTG